MTDDRLLTQKEVCARLRISSRTLQKWRNSGRLAFKRFGHRTVRITEAALARFERSAGGKSSADAAGKARAAAGASGQSNPLPSAADLDRVADEVWQRERNDGNARNQ